MAILVKPPDVPSTRDTILFLGAGFSKWAADLPVAATLFDFAIDTNSVREAQRLRTVQRDKEVWDSKNPNGLAEVFIQQMLDASDAKRRRGEESLGT